jgi:hypothetical protein
MIEKKISGALREEKIAENAHDSDYNINFISTSRLQNYQVTQISHNFLKVTTVPPFHHLLSILVAPFHPEIATTSVPEIFYNPNFR